MKKKIIDYIKGDLPYLSRGYVGFSELAGKRVQSNLTGKSVSVITPPSEQMRSVVLQKPQTLTGDGLIIDSATKFVYLKTKEGLWIDATYLEEVPKAQKDNSLLYGFLAVLALSLFSK
jgi:hypothetical protein